MVKKVVLIRLDKIGDLICTLPTDQVLDHTVFQTTWVIQKGLGSILDLGEKKRKYIELDKSKPDQSRKIFAEFLKNNQFDYAISFQCPWWINYELFKAGIKKRIGVLSQWHSFLFLNSGVRQKRSLSIKHEFQYNLELVQKIIGPLIQDTQKIFFRFRKPVSTETLDRFELKPGYVVIHPGMMGSALNWPQSYYITHIQKLISEGQKIVITGTAADQPYLDQIQSVFSDHPQVLWLQNNLNFSELLDILHYSAKVIAPSTGVAHIAASLGKETHCLFSPIRVHHHTRWAPRGDHVHIHDPQVKCPAAFHCLKQKCIHYDCMTQITL